MGLLILKSSACLAVFMLFYKLCLEKTSAHIFKRFYLIGVILISIGIPFITFTEYIEVEPVHSYSNTHPTHYTNIEFTETTQTKNSLRTILWSIYALGVMLFSCRFFKNLNQLFQKIKENPKYKKQSFINVLILNLITPHTFFNYIFLNKTAFENNKIPNEVLLHEQAHAKQKHTIDILFIEVLQILFWFNPLLYFIKKDIKLNHEFLADHAVLSYGTNTKSYQELLLAFSSNASHSSLANAINYSLIKKRFTVMQTKTSKTVLWLRSFIVLPLLAILIYGFSDKIIIQKENNNQLKQNTTHKIKLFNYLNEKRLEAENKLKESSSKDSSELKLINKRLYLIQKDLKTNTKQKKETSTKTVTVIITIIDKDIIAINGKKYGLKNLRNSKQNFKRAQPIKNQQENETFL